MTTVDGRDKTGDCIAPYKVPVSRVPSAAQAIEIRLVVKKKQQEGRLAGRGTHTELRCRLPASTGEKKAREESLRLSENVGDPLARD